MNNQQKSKLKIAFVSWPEYFDCLYEDDLSQIYDVYKFKLTFFASWYYYERLIDVQPDIIFFFRPELYSDELLRRLKGVKVAISSEPIPHYEGNKLVASADMKQRFKSLLGAKNRYDKFYHYDKTSIRFLIENGFKVDGDFLFPVATGTYFQYQDIEKKLDGFFVGRDTEYRNNYLMHLKRDFKILHICHGLYGSELVDLMNKCKIGFNIHVDQYYTSEPRVQMMMACGLMVMSEPLSNNDLFVSDKHYVVFKDRRELAEKFIFYLHHDAEREIIAKNGMDFVRKNLNSKKVFQELINNILSK